MRDVKAFPTSTFQNGMDLRDWFAGQFAASAVVGHLTGEANLCMKTIARDSYDAADAMMKAREENNNA